MHKNILTVVGITILFLGTCITPTVAIDTIEQSSMPISNGNILYVGGSGPGNYTRIQDAIDNASYGDTVFVYDDSSPYYEHIKIRNSINLVGEDKNTTIIDGEDITYLVNISADCVNISGFMIKNSIIGIWIYWKKNNCTISGNIISNNRFGIYVIDSSNITIDDNIIIDNSILLTGSIGNIIINNTFYGKDGLILGRDYRDSCCDNIISYNSFFNTGISISRYVCNNIITNNTVNGKLLVYLFGETDKFIDVDAGQIILVSCDNITIQNQEISNTSIGIYLGDTNNCLITNNTISSNHENGIELFKSNSNNIEGNTILNSGSTGILLYYDCDNNISGNIINSATINGIYLGDSDYNKIIGNNFSNNFFGIRAFGNNNFIFHNNFINNRWNAEGVNNNTWDDGKYGNYWSDYKEEYPKARKKPFKGIWDTPYEIKGGGSNNDSCPLINQWPKSRTRTITRTKPFIFNFPLISWFLERFPMLGRLLNLLR